MNSTEIRKKFVSFFEQHKHTHVPSSPLIPAEDPTLLFANAGMNQFKDIFLGKEKRSYTRAVTVQKCMRAGGKHNDLENVGFTKRHLTFFEMLGNFSFGDYFKKDAIMFAWEFLTKEIGLDKNKLYASVYQKDDEAYEIWHTTIGLPKERIIRLGEADNFWQMGDTGPCGPCSEIYVDRGEMYGCKSKECAPGCSCDRFLEIWNLVFMQFDRQANGAMQPLKQTGVDTGMGLERLCAVVENKDSVFETDVFAVLIASIQKISGKKYANADTATKAAFHVLADHVRSVSFAIADGCVPSNEGRGYVIRKIIRRAALFAQKLGAPTMFQELVEPFIASMCTWYPELRIAQPIIVRIVIDEVQKFTHNLVQGQAILQTYVAQNSTTKMITGDIAFKLYDTYGFPLELTKLIAAEHGFVVDEKVFEHCMEEQRKQSGKKTTATEITLDDSIATVFTGYDELETQTKIVALLCRATMVETAPAGERCWVITARSPLYVECGGQVSDTGFVTINGARMPIVALKKIGKAIACEIIPAIALTKGMSIAVVVDQEQRASIARNHTATHMLQSALVQVIGPQVKQAGSLVSAEHARFDFTCDTQITADQIKAIELVVNKKILENIPLEIRTTTLQEATKAGVTAFFGEKYNPESVRVVSVPGFSAELCGGAHVRATGDIGCCKIIESSAPSAGSRRIVAVTGLVALQTFQDQFATTKTLCQNFKVQPAELLSAVAKQADALKVAQHAVTGIRQKYVACMIPQWATQTEIINDIAYGFVQVQDVPATELRDIANELLRIKPGLYCIVSATAGKVQFFVGLSAQFVAKVSLKNLAQLLQQFGLKGGTTETALQGGGESMPANLKDTVKQWLLTAS